ncbi:hypothetical protein FHG87_003802 [Trinorchestia longiramus]|nr:hypothetical protein FHG87_003802 [Trinorchestia longiramus]
MVIETEIIMEVIVDVTKERGLMVCLSNSLKGGAAVGGAATVGSILLGPLGLLVGGTLGGAIASYCFNGQYKSAVSVIMDMPQQKKDQLAAKVIRVLQSLDAIDLATATALVLRNNENVQELVLKEVINYLSQDMKMNVIT